MYDYDIAVPGDARDAEKEKEKIETYQDLSLRREIERLWNVKTIVVPVVIGRLGMVSGNLPSHLEKIRITTKRYNYHRRQLF